MLVEVEIERNQVKGKGEEGGLPGTYEVSVAETLAVYSFKVRLPFEKKRCSVLLVSSSVTAMWEVGQAS